MLAWVYEAAKACRSLDDVIVATDSEEVVQVCVRHGWTHVLTSPDLPSGTDRVQAVAELLPADIYVNIQGDEPLLDPDHLTALLHCFENPEVQVSTLKVLCSPGSVSNQNAVKVVTAKDGRALYFSRATIPFDREGAHPAYWKHIGLYAYRKAILHQFPALPVSELEQIERLEQLRFLDNGISIQVAVTTIDTIGVDTQEDLEHVERLLLTRIRCSESIPEVDPASTGEHEW